MAKRKNPKRVAAGKKAAKVRWAGHKKKSSKKTTKRRGPGRPKGSKNVKCIVNLRDLQDLASGKAVLRRG